MKFVPDDLKPYLKMSLAFHASIFLIFGVKVLFFPDLSHLDDTPSIKVDLVALPDKGDNKVVPKILEKPKDTKEQSKKAETPAEKPKPVVAQKPQEKSDPAKPDNTKPETTKPDDSIDEMAALSRLRELEALKNIETTTQPKEANNAAPIKGNRLAVGDAIEGVNKIQYNNYKKVLQDAVKYHWDLPPWLQDGDLNAEVLIKIDETGLVTAKELIKSSGNSIYDKYVLETITKSSPFPPPDDKFVNVVAIKGVVLSFN